MLKEQGEEMGRLLTIFLAYQARRRPILSSRAFVCSSCAFSCFCLRASQEREKKKRGATQGRGSGTPPFSSPLTLSLSLHSPTPPSPPCARAVFGSTVDDVVSLEQGSRPGLVRCSLSFALMLCGRPPLPPWESSAPGEPMVCPEALGEEEQACASESREAAAAPQARPGEGLKDNDSEEKDNDSEEELVKRRKAAAAALALTAAGVVPGPAARAAAAACLEDALSDPEFSLEDAGPLLLAAGAPAAPPVPQPTFWLTAKPGGELVAFEPNPRLPSLRLPFR